MEDTASSTTMDKFLNTITSPHHQITEISNRIKVIDYYKTRIPEKRIAEKQIFIIIF